MPYIRSDGGSGGSAGEYTVTYQAVQGIDGRYTYTVVPDNNSMWDYSNVTATKDGRIFFTDGPAKREKKKLLVRDLLKLMDKPTQSLEEGD